MHLLFSQGFFPLSLPPFRSFFLSISFFKYLLVTLFPATVLGTVSPHQPLPVQSYREVGAEVKGQVTAQIVHCRGVSGTKGELRGR